MAIGTATAIGLGVAGIGAALGASSTNKAANKAADTSLAVANSNNALARENRDMLMGKADPYINSGQQANAMLDSFLYGAQPAAQPNPAASATQDWNGYLQANPDVRAEWSRNAFDDGFASEQDFARWHYGRYGRNEGREVPTVGGQPATPGQPAANPMDGFRQYIQNSDYGFQFGEGSNALNSGYAGAGTLQSGAAMKAMEDYRQNLQSGYRNEYLNRLSGQQGAGLNALGAAAGVGTNYVNQVSANNNNAGTAAANAALVKGANNPFASMLGVIGGGILGR